MVTKLFVHRTTAHQYSDQKIVHYTAIPRDDIYHRVDIIRTINEDLWVLISMEGHIKILPSDKASIFYPEMAIDMADETLKMFHRAGHQHWLTARMKDDSLEVLYEKVKI